MIKSMATSKLVAAWGIVHAAPPLVPARDGGEGRCGAGRSGANLSPPVRLAAMQRHNLGAGRDAIKGRRDGK